MGKLKTVNSLSGGASSGYIAVHYPADYDIFSLVCIDDPRCSPKDKSIIQYVNDKLGSKYINRYGEFIATAESDKTLYAMRELEQFIGREIIWVRGQSFDTILETKGLHGGIPTMLPNKIFRYCTDRMKMEALFEWWLINIGEKVDMRIGFRSDEFDRMERFFNGGEATTYKIPTSQRTYGQKLQSHTTFNWRNCRFILIKAGIDNVKVKTYWKGKPVEFPEISNCVFCFWKTFETLCIQAVLEPEKMQWAAEKELIGKGTWINGMSFDKIINHAKHSDVVDLIDYNLEIINQRPSCDSGGCTN